MEKKLVKPKRNEGNRVKYLKLSPGTPLYRKLKEWAEEKNMTILEVARFRLEKDLLEK